MTATPCIISAADHAGWAHFVCVAAPRGVPVVVERRRVATIDAGLPTMPYHHESVGMPAAAADALIARMRRSVARCTSRALRDLITELSPAHHVVGLAIRKLRFEELPDSVATVRQSYPLQCAADGMIYQLTLCAAARDLGLQVHLFGRGEENARAAAQLGVDSSDIESFVTVTGRPSGPPWTEEHRRAYSAGIAVLGSGARHRIRLRQLKSSIVPRTLQSPPP